MQIKPSDMRILIVDDTPANIDVLGKTLKPIGYNIAIAQSGEQAIKVAAHFVPDLILLDIMMPEMDGYETCQKIKKIDTIKNIPIIFITAKQENEDIVKGFEVGAVDFISKPFCQAIVCARVKSHLELHRSMIELAEFNYQKNRFLGMAAHDLRNPLTAILGFSELIHETEGSEKKDLDHINKWSNNITVAAHEMITLITNLLDVSAIENGGINLDKKHSPLLDFMEDIINTIQVQSNKKLIELKMHCPENLSLNYDRHYLSLVITNLLSNAIKFSQKNTTISVLVRQHKNDIEFSVEDQGPGIPEDEIGKIFDDFQTLSTLPTAGEKSTGLGMSIVRDIVEAHDGIILVDSEVGRGSKFTVCLPAEPQIKS